MTEETQTQNQGADNPNTPLAEPKQEPAKTFTQEELDKIIQDRLAKEKSIQEKKAKELEDARLEAERIAKLEGEEKIKAEYEQKLKAEQTARVALNAELIRTSAITSLAKLGYSNADDLVECVLKNTKDDTEAAITALHTAIKKTAEGITTAAIKGGAPQGGNSKAVDAEMRKIFGL